MSKANILEWIDKCKHKALKSVDKSIKKQLNTILEGHKTIQDSLNEYKECEKTLKRLKGFYEYGGAETHPPYVNIKLEKSYYYLNGDLVFVYQYLNKKAKAGYVEYNALFEEVNSKIDKYYQVRCEYDSLYEKVKRIRNAKTILDYLENLGFDTSTIEGVEKDNINRDLLFVCGDNKPDESV